MRDNLSMLIPTRSRPQAAEQVLDACAAADTHWQTTILFGVDSDDETLEDYRHVVRHAHNVTARVLVVEPGKRRGMVAALNQMVEQLDWTLTRQDSSTALGFMGDDHRPRTPQWDRKLLAALGDHQYAIAYGNDLLQGENLATASVMTNDIPRTLGYMALPTLTHLEVDTVWMDWGRATHLTYLPDVILEHMHPVAGKAALDEGYTAVNSHEVSSQDKIAYDTYVAHGLADDVKQMTE